MYIIITYLLALSISPPASLASYVISLTPHGSQRQLAKTLYRFHSSALIIKCQVDLKHFQIRLLDQSAVVNARIIHIYTWFVRSCRVRLQDRPIN